MRQRTYMCIDLKSFYASVECVERGLDPLATDLVVADKARGRGTICLAVSPSLKAKGVRNRCRLFEIPFNRDYIIAPPRMRRYIEYSADIYAIYLRYVAKEDIHPYSVDEVFIDATPYLSLYGMTARELGDTIRKDILARTGIPATCGIGSNLYLAKVALDILAKHSPGFIAELDETSYKQLLWNHQPLSDFWGIAGGITRRLATLDIHTMAQLALYPAPEDLYRVFGVNAAVLIDHAWGRERTTIRQIRSYRPRAHSLSNGQVLKPHSGTYGTAFVIAKEMADGLSLRMDARQIACRSLTLWVVYEGTEPPMCATARFSHPACTETELVGAVSSLFQANVNPAEIVSRLCIIANNTISLESGQLSLFQEPQDRCAERVRQRVINRIRLRFGRNAIFRGRDLVKGATALERNMQIGGHRSGEGVGSFRGMRS